MQNDNGGFASYELTRSYPWLEVINHILLSHEIMPPHSMKYNNVVLLLMFRVSSVDQPRGNVWRYRH